MYPAHLHKTVTLEKKYWRTYITCAVVFGSMAMLNIMASVQTMYSNSSAQAYEYKKQQLTADIQSLEKEQSTLTNLHAIQAQAIADGYTTVSDLKYAAAPLSQVVAVKP
jgi:hypothetical protein